MTYRENGAVADAKYYTFTDAPSAANFESLLKSVGRYGMLVFGICMFAVQAVVFFGPPPTSDRAAAIMALVLYIAFAGIAYWLERKRVPVSHP